MLFSSLEFILVFLPVVVLAYFLLPRILKNSWLLIMSLVFYAWGEPVFVFIMLGSIVVNYGLALAIQGAPTRSERRILLILDVALNLGNLFVFKYLNFVTGVLRSLIPAAASLIPQTAIALPIGISFFTFQAMSYVIDVYRGTPAQKNPLDLGLYVSLFPQLVAGPIVRYTTVAEEIRSRRTTPQGFASGLMRFLLGFNKKVLLANTLSELAEAAFGSTQLGAGMAWLGAISYSFQIFFDFSGYSDMAIGLGEMFGFHFLENFNYPYISGTITEFWRRWHISLGSWFRDYVYFPLGGSRVSSKLILVRNLAVVWLLTGIWHGANWTFLAWGGLYGLVLIFEKLTDLPKRLRGWILPVRLLYRVFTLLAVVLGWVLFNSADIGSAVRYIGDMFGASGLPAVDSDFLFQLREYSVFLGAAVLCSVPLLKRFHEAARELGGAAGNLIGLVFQAAQLVLFLVSIGCLVMNTHNPFIYFNF